MFIENLVYLCSQSSHFGNLWCLCWCDCEEIYRIWMLCYWQLWKDWKLTKNEVCREILKLGEFETW